MILGRGVIMLYILWVAEILLKLMIDFSLSSRVNDAFSLFGAGFWQPIWGWDAMVAGFFGTHQKLSSFTTQLNAIKKRLKREVFQFVERQKCLFSIDSTGNLSKTSRLSRVFLWIFCTTDIHL